MLATGVAWFAGTVADAVGAAEPLLFAHRPLLVLVVAGTIRPRGTALFALGAAAATVHPAVTAAGWPLLVAAAAVASIAPRRPSGPAVLAAAAFACGGALTLSGAGTEAARAGLVLYMVCVVGAAALAARGAAVRAGGGLADRVIELGDAGSLCAALAEALEDPSLKVLPPDGHNGTPVVRDGEVIAVIAHAPETLRDPRVADAAVTATRLALENEELIGRLRTGLDDIRASTRRLEVAGERAGRRLEERIRMGPERRLVAAAERLDGPLGHRLQVARDELRDLAAGLHPRALGDGGLRPALAELVARAPVPLSTDVTAGRFPPEVELAAFFICAEALANVGKYGGASRAEIRVAVEGDALLVEVSDDGAGGADPARGSGLRGLRDRALGLSGELEVHSPPGRGTTVTARLPLRVAA